MVGWSLTALSAQKKQYHAVQKLKFVKDFFISFKMWKMHRYPLCVTIAHMAVAKDCTKYQSIQSNHLKPVSILPRLLLSTHSLFTPDTVAACFLLHDYILTVKHTAYCIYSSTFSAPAISVSLVLNFTFSGPTCSASHSIQVNINTDRMSTNIAALQ